MKLKLIPRSLVVEKPLDDYACQAKDCEFVISLKPGFKEAEFVKEPVDVCLADHTKSFHTIGVLVDDDVISALRDAQPRRSDGNQEVP